MVELTIRGHHHGGEPGNVLPGSEPVATISSKEGVGPLSSNTYTFGRDPQCDLNTDHDSVSRTHAELVPTEQGLFITDCNSSNGTFVVNGGRASRIRQGRASSSDAVRFGDVEFSVKALIGDIKKLQSKRSLAPDRGGAIGPVSQTYYFCKCGSPGPRGELCRVCKQHVIA